MVDNNLGYSNSQFLNFEDYESKTTLDRTSADNPEFAYPGNRIPNIYDHAGQSTTNTLVQRGFIRGIIPEVLSQAVKLDKTYTNANNSSKIVKRRCFFQFNPSLILRSVQASTTVLNPLLQPATELLQPIPGQAAFEFQLLFNREREVSNHKMASGFKSGDPTMADTSFYGNSLASYGSKGSEYNQNHVSDLGVLSDLYVLDSIIGQSITADAIESLQAYWDITKRNKQDKKTVTANDDGTTTTVDYKKNGDIVTTITEPGKEDKVSKVSNPDAFQTFDFTSAETKTKLEGVLGNSAFLSPLPVRIVFSSLFMVEGFVTASNVAFHKFNAQMVPTVCTVTLNVQALYLGFAKKDSYVSKQMYDQLSSVIGEASDTIKNRNTAIEALKNNLHVNLSFVKPHGRSPGDSLNEWARKGIAANWRYSSGNGTRFDSGIDNDGFEVLIDTPLQKLISSAAIQNINITSVELLICDKDKLPAKFKSPQAIKKGIETYKFPPATRTVPGLQLVRVPINLVTQRLMNGRDTAENTLVSTLESAKIENAVLGKPDKRYFSAWQSGDFTTSTTTTPNTFFKNKIVMILIVKIKANCLSGDGETLEDLGEIVKSAVFYDIDPNSSQVLDNFKTKGALKRSLNYFAT